MPAPERYSADWFLAQLSGRDPETDGDAVAPEIATDAIDPIDDVAPTVEAPAEPHADVELELEAVAAPHKRFRRRGAIALAALGLCIAAVAFAVSVPPAVEPSAANAEPTQGEQGHGMKPVQLPTLSVPEDQAPPVPDGTDPEKRQVYSPPRTETDAPTPSSPSTPHPSSTPTPTPSDTPTPTPSSTPTPTPTPTSSSTPTPEPSDPPSDAPTDDPSDPPTDDPPDPPADPPTDDTCILFIICF